MPVKPRLLDLFCGAGGCTKGYQRAGFHVVGVDINPQPNYCGDMFIRADALSVFDAGFWLIGGIGDFDAIHASPPCQAYSSLRALSDATHPDLVAPTRDLLRSTGLPYVIENVVGAPLNSPTVLCGSTFGLGCLCRDGKWRQLRRHRLFESTFPVLGATCVHHGEPVGVYGHGGGQQKTVWNGGANRGYIADLREAQAAMDIDWMTKRELSQAIPPAYTELIGAQLLDHLRVKAAA